MTEHSYFRALRHRLKFDHEYATSAEGLLAAEELRRHDRSRSRLRKSKRLSSMSPEQREELARHEQAYQKAYRENRSEEAKAAYREYQRLYQRMLRASMTEEQLEKRRAYQRDYVKASRENMTDEERAKHNAARKEYRKAREARMTEEEKRARSTRQMEYNKVYKERRKALQQQLPLSPSFYAQIRSEIAQSPNPYELIMSFSDKLTKDVVAACGLAHGAFLRMKGAFRFGVANVEPIPDHAFYTALLDHIEANFSLPEDYASRQILETVLPDEYYGVCYVLNKPPSCDIILCDLPRRRGRPRKPRDQVLPPKPIGRPRKAPEERYTAPRKRYADMTPEEREADRQKRRLKRHEKIMSMTLEERLAQREIILRKHREWRQRRDQRILQEMQAAQTTTIDNSVCE